MKKQLSASLEELLSLFPFIEPPITISEESTISFSSKNKPISQKLMDEYFNVWENIDEYSEIVPCFQLKQDGPFFTIVYWKGSLLTYEYILANIDQNNILISKKIIAGTISNGLTVKKSVATIDENYGIYTMVGEQNLSERSYNPTHSSAYRFEIEPDGSISSSNEEKNLWEETENRKN